MPDEMWKTKDGREIAVGDMTPDHAKNALRMILRKRRKALARVAEQLFDTEFDWESQRDAQAYRDLANPSVFFPLLNGGVYGSPDLQKKYGER